MDSKAVVSDENFDAFIAKMKAEEYFGVVEAHFEKGQIVRVKRHETLLDRDIKNLIDS